MPNPSTNACPDCGAEVGYDDGMPDRGEVTCRWNPNRAVWSCSECDWSMSVAEMEAERESIREASENGN